MKYRALFFKAVLVLTLGTCVGAPSVATKNASFDALVGAIFPGKAADQVSWSEFQQLTDTQRNELAEAATREFSLRTGGVILTGPFVDALLHKDRATDTPNDAALRQLHYRNERRMIFLRELSNGGLITNSVVIGPLVDMVAYPGRNTIIPSTALDILQKLTRINCGEDFQAGRDRSSARREQVVEWWRAWWETNRNKHVIMDSGLEARLKARIAVIQHALSRDFKEFGEMRYFDPDHIRIRHQEPLIDLATGTMLSSQLFTRPMPDGTVRPAKSDDHIYVRILAQYGTPPAGPQDGPRYENWVRFDKTPIVEILRETLPSTDIVITVGAASKDGDFMRRIKECMRRLPPAPKTVDDAHAAADASEQAEIK